MGGKWHGARGMRHGAWGKWKSKSGVEASVWKNGRAKASGQWPPQDHNQNQKPEPGPDAFEIEVAAAAARSHKEQSPAGDPSIPVSHHFFNGQQIPLFTPDFKANFRASSR